MVVLRKDAVSFVWRRAGDGKMADEELYPSDAQWAGIYDRMRIHYPEETKRRLELAVAYGAKTDAAAAP